MKKLISILFAATLTVSLFAQVKKTYTYDSSK